MTKILNKFLVLSHTFSPTKQLKSTPPKKKKKIYKYRKALKNHESHTKFHPQTHNHESHTRKSRATIETDLCGGVVTDGTLTLFLGTVTHSPSSLKKATMSSLISRRENPKLGFSAIKKLSSSSFSSKGSTCSLPATSESPSVTFHDWKLKTTLWIS